MRSEVIFGYYSEIQRTQAATMKLLIQQKKFAEALRYFADELVAEPDCGDAILFDSNDLIEEAAYYYAAWLQVAEGQYDLVSEYLSHVPAETMGDVGLLSYQAFRDGSSQIYDQIGKLDRKGGILIASMPKSASSYVSSLVSSLTDMPVVRASFGQFPSLVAVPSWLDTLRQFGGVTHDHLLPTSWTEKAIVAAGITDVFIQYRDPRAAAWSAYMQYPEHSIERFTSHLDWFNEWLHGWLRIWDATPPFRMHFISYDEVRSHPRQVFLSILEICGHEVDCQILDATLVRAADEKHLYNFRSGDPEEWQKMLEPRFIALADTRLSPRVRECLRLC